MCTHFLGTLFLEREGLEDTKVVSTVGCSKKGTVIYAIKGTAYMMSEDIKHVIFLIYCNLHFHSMILFRLFIRYEQDTDSMRTNPGS